LSNEGSIRWQVPPVGSLSFMEGCPNITVPSSIPSDLLTHRSRGVQCSSPNTAVSVAGTPFPPCCFGSSPVFRAPSLRHWYWPTFPHHQWRLSSRRSPPWRRCGQNDGVGGAGGIPRRGRDQLILIRVKLTLGARNQIKYQKSKSNQMPSANQ
jgi:hypothetical protein